MKSVLTSLRYTTGFVVILLLSFATSYGQIDYLKDVLSGAEDDDSFTEYIDEIEEEPIYAYDGDDHTSFPEHLREHPFVRLQSDICDDGVAESYPWISADALRVYYVKGHDVYQASRLSRYSNFTDGRPIGVEKLTRSIISVWLSNNECTLVAGDGSSFSVFTRETRSASWNFDKTIERPEGVEGFVSMASFTPDMKVMSMYNSPGPTGGQNLAICDLGSDGQYHLRLKFQPMDTMGVGQITKDGASIVFADNRFRSGIHQVLMADIERANPNVVTLFRHPDLDLGQPCLSYDENYLIFGVHNTGNWDGNDLVVINMNKVEFIEEAESYLKKETADELKTDAQTALKKANEIQNDNKIIEDLIVSNNIGNEDETKGLGAEDFDFQVSKVYPNPTAGRITVEYDLPVNTNSAELVIQDAKGLEVYRKRLGVESRMMEVDFNSIGVANGNYFIWIRSNGSFSHPHMVAYH